MTNIPNIGKDTIARTVAAALALLNSALVMAGKAPLNLDEIRPALRRTGVQI